MATNVAVKLQEQGRVKVDKHQCIIFGIEQVIKHKISGLSKTFIISQLQQLYHDMSSILVYTKTTICLILKSGPSD